MRRTIPFHSDDRIDQIPVGDTGKMRVQDRLAKILDRAAAVRPFSCGRIEITEGVFEARGDFGFNVRLAFGHIEKSVGFRRLDRNPEPPECRGKGCSGFCKTFRI